MDGYRERLVPGPGTALAVLLLLPALFAALLPVSPFLAAATAIAVTALVEAGMFLGAPVVRIEGGQLQAGRAHIPVALTGEASPHRGPDATVARGVGLDARAWTLLRGWVGPVARIAITDPDDPVPYWLISTRRPEALIAALQAARG